MAKPTYQIFTYLATDGPLPGRDNTLYLAARHVEPTEGGATWDFLQPILPQFPDHKPGKFWDAHPQEYKLMQRGAIPAEEAVVKFLTWLDKFPGKKVAITTAIEHWHLVNLMLRYGTKCPFGTGCLDLGSYGAGRRKESERSGVTIYPTPLENLEQRASRFKKFNAAKTEEAF